MAQTPATQPPRPHALDRLPRFDPGRGLATVMHKELSDHFSSRRFMILFSLIAIAGIAALYVAAVSIRATVAEAGEGSFVFLSLFTTTDGRLPSFVTFIALLGPLVGLALGFDAVNGELARGTLSRVLAQPIFRDQFINGKFGAALIVVAIMVFSLGALVSGLGILMIGVPPTFEEFLRSLIFLAVSVVYIAFWLNLAIMFSTYFTRAATSALAGIATWLFFALFFSLLVGLFVSAVVPVSDAATLDQVLRHERLQLWLSRLSPNTLYSEAAMTILSPTTVRTTGPVTIEQLHGAIPGPLSLGQSLLLIWPQLVGLIAQTTACFALAYVRFMRQEIRAG